MKIDPTIAFVAICALLLVGSLIGMFIATFWGLRRVVADVVRIEFGWLHEWKKTVDSEREQVKKDESGIFTRLRLVESDVAVLKGPTR